MKALLTISLMILYLVPTHARGQAVSLEQILANMDRRAETFSSMKCSIHQKRWTDLLQEFDAGEEGHFSFLKTDEGVFLKREIVEPGRHITLIADDTFVFYQPAIKQALKRNLGGNKDQAEFLLLGFGTNREALKEAYQTRMLGQEEIDGRTAYQLELTPRSKEVAAFFPRIVLWIDAEMWVPVQQKLVEPTQDFLLVRFQNVQLNPRLSESDFELKLPADVRIIQG